MKNMHFIYYVAIVFLCLTYACSYEDKTTYADMFIPNIIIDTAGILLNLRCLKKVFPRICSNINGL